ncbi:MAG: precorrin-8X methylmutase [Sneathiella sp.]|nr:MAG: precorrin-8X methylmutase [Sneathiella sp.]
MFDYLRDPKSIYEKSFSTIKAEANFARFDAATEVIATRIIHACGMPEILDDIVFSDGFADAARTALASGAPILSDCEMVTHGIIRRMLPAANAVICTLNHEGVPETATKMKTTRSAAAIELWRPHLDGAIAVFGNAPTALFHLLEMLEAGAPKPAAILGFPVGFVGAAESKTALAASDLGIPFITVQGRKGGSAMAAAALNGISSLSGAPS